MFACDHVDGSVQQRRPGTRIACGVSDACAKAGIGRSACEQPAAAILDADNRKGTGHARTRKQDQRDRRDGDRRRGDPLAQFGARLPARSRSTRRRSARSWNWRRARRPAPTCSRGRSTSPSGETKQRIADAILNSGIRAEKAVWDEYKYYPDQFFEPYLTPPPQGRLRPLRRCSASAAATSTRCAPSTTATSCSSMRRSA